jgi:hypothetical protein
LFKPARKQDKKTSVENTAKKSFVEVKLNLISKSADLGMSNFKTMTRLNVTQNPRKLEYIELKFTSKSSKYFAQTVFPKAADQPSI